MPHSRIRSDSASSLDDRVRSPISKTSCTRTVAEITLVLLVKLLHERISLSFREVSSKYHYPQQAQPTDPLPRTRLPAYLQETASILLTNYSESRIRWSRFSLFSFSNRENESKIAWQRVEGNCHQVYTSFFLNEVYRLLNYKLPTKFV